MYGCEPHFHDGHKDDAKGRLKVEGVEGTRLRGTVYYARSYEVADVMLTTMERIIR